MWEDGKPVERMNQKKYARVRLTLPQGLRLGLPPHTASSQPLGQTQAPRARVKGKNITSVPGMNQKMMNQNLMNQKMTNSLSTKVYAVRQQ